MLSVCGLVAAQGAQTTGAPADIRICPQETIREVSPQFMGAALSPAVSREVLKSPAVLLQIKELGIKTICFPGGCRADTYNWANPGEDQISMDEFLDFCDAIGATACYVVNMQGGTLGTEGRAPSNADIEGRIRHRHAPPEGCAEAKPYFGTLDDAVALVHKYTVLRAVEGKPPLKRFVLGHDHWRRAATDWPPDVYAHTSEVFAQAMLRAVVAAGDQQPQAAEVDLDFAMLGCPLPKGENDSAAETERAINRAWTQKINQLAGLIGAAQEPIPALGASGGAALSRAAGELAGILAVRNGLDAGQPGDYTEPDLQYELPLAWMAGDFAEAATGSLKTTAARATDDYARQLHSASVLCTLLGQSTPYVCIHDLVGTSSTALFGLKGEELPRTRPLQLLAGRIGKQLVRTTIQPNTATPPGAIDAHLAVTATRDENEVYVFLMNRAPEQPAAASIFLQGCTLKPAAELRTLTAQGIDTSAISVSNPVRLTVPPFAAQVLRIGLDQVIKTPLLTSAERFRYAVRIGECPATETLTLRVMAPDQELESTPGAVTTAPQSAKFTIQVDADWLEVSPTVGWVTFLQPQDIDIAYRTGQLPPGHYSATISIFSPDTYNSPKRLPVEVTVRTVRADFDDDGDVDADDFAKFVACMMAAPAVQAGPECAHARLNGDDRVDQEDFAALVRCFSGPGQRPGEECPE